MDSSSITTLIFDLGEVVIDVNTRKTETAFLNLSKSKSQNFFSFSKQTEAFNLFEKGLITANQFRSEIINELGDDSISFEEFDFAWNAMLGNIPDKKKDILLALKTKFKVYALSNTNQIHIQKINQQLVLNNRDFLLEDLFHQAFYSFEIGQRKPDAEAFQYVLDQTNTSPQNALMIDDRLENLETAMALGMNVLHLKHPDEFYLHFKPNAEVTLP